MKSSRKPGLLAPANSIESVGAAFDSGADAVYFGVSGWGLRPAIFELKMGDLLEARRIADAHSGELYACMNILPEPDEVGAFIHDARRLRDSGVDALIISDLGMIRAVKKAVPGMSIHASVQLNTSNEYAALFLEELGCDVVILSRSQYDLPAIRRICRATKASVEVFVHGDVCWNYDGKCYLTGYMKREEVRAHRRRKETGVVGCSNRGECTLVCKHRASLSSGGKNVARGNLLRRADLCLLSELPALISAGVRIFKIEGRQFSVEYIRQTTRVYRQAIDLAHSLGKSYRPEPAWFEELEPLLAERDTSYEYQRRAWLGRL
jgi:putative protease